MLDQQCRIASLLLLAVPSLNADSVMHPSRFYILPLLFLVEVYSPTPVLLGMLVCKSVCISLINVCMYVIVFYASVAPEIVVL